MNVYINKPTNIKSNIFLHSQFLTCKIAAVKINKNEIFRVNKN